MSIEQILVSVESLRLFEATFSGKRGVWFEALGSIVGGTSARLVG